VRRAGQRLSVAPSVDNFPCQRISARSPLCRISRSESMCA
jgi:hypothetical protein